jgi:hypothetical protein
MALSEFRGFGPSKATILMRVWRIFCVNHASQSPDCRIAFQSENPEKISGQGF